MDLRPARRETLLPLSRMCLALAVVGLLAGCGEKKASAPTSQTAAKVNKEEITVHQINAVLQQQRGVSADQLEAASRQILERLIDQELAIQSAAETKLDRDPKVAQSIEAARREIIARAYAEKIGETASQATPAEVKDYYDKNPVLFKDRRIYQYQEIIVQASPEQTVALRTKLAVAKNVNEVVDYMKANNIAFTGNLLIRPAEQVPLAALPAMAKMKDGEMQLAPTPTGARVTVLVSSRAQPVELDKATPAIEQYLLEQRKRELILQHLRDKRAAAQIQYVGKYAASAPDSVASQPQQAASAPNVGEIVKGLGK